LDGILGEGELRHLARWQAVKTILRVEEEDENAVTTIREKEQFSDALNILYADGHTAVLTNDPPPQETDEKTAATHTSGQAVVYVGCPNR
jgi:prepilin-type processing-associated H-X9-DG protein